MCLTLSRPNSYASTNVWDLYVHLIHYSHYFQLCETLLPDHCKNLATCG